MRDVRVKTGNGKFGQRVEVGSHVLTADEDKAAGGDDTGPAPHELLLGALGACTSMTVRMYADRKGALAAIANTTVIPVCQSCGTGIEIQLRALAANVHAVGDVVGYFWNPGLPKRYRQNFSLFNVLPTVTNTDVVLATVSFTPFRTGDVVVRANGFCSINGGPGEDQTVFGVNSATNPLLGPERLGVIRIPGTLPDTQYQPMFTVQDTVAVTGGVPAMITLEAGRLSVPGPGIQGDCFANVMVEETFP